ncbi:MAG: chromosome segregation protein SMC [Candidatus Dadabacteria bacterium]|nr:chromosome segregation protein SMC [Candidatus Dadabacteria bacterium]NIS08721.1 chromosome segregation protein SMC [Candidatus Dadabacteria bacterium]NIV42605.1 chromosome segregation protein SMC [Candidatus Dadabacteria bacterium]NIX15407.1 chromosome segregation protein SMC [Candidatus Dadabacteria bacterium]NIY22070.1 chromosome segregation protein SMC [Candidatus Dadabacteria bacterium]
MKLLKLEFNGFKSFYDKTKIDFHSNINAIVGPNGCGKSNIIDAIKWVLGEQNPRNLRAMTMEEVISNGGETLKPLGMAEVSLVVSSNGSGYEEINVKRRLFRSGQSEYYINNVPCRLKDITELFVDTGVGARAYSIIGQGKVESIITSKPEGKREVIEEVAGIGKYKLRRKETQNRIELTKNNLTVVKESQSEILRQIKSLKRQAQDAEKYKQIAEEIEQIERLVFVRKKNELEELKNKTETRSLEIKNSISQKSEIYSQLQSGRQRIVDKITRIDEQIEALKNEFFNDTKKLHTAENSIELNNREENIVTDTLYTINTDKINNLKEIENIEQTTSRKLSELKALNLDVAEKEQELSGKQQLTDSYKNDLLTKRQQYQEHREGLLKSLDEYGSVKTKVVTIEKDVKDLESRIYRLKNEKQQTGIKMSLNTADLRIHENDLKNVVASKISLADKLIRIGNELTELNDKKAGLDASLLENREKYNQAKSHLAAIEKIQTNYEWLPSELSKFILEHKGAEVLGVLADYISVSEKYDRAVEAALGEKLKWSVVNNKEQAFSLISSLKNEKTGRGTFIPLDISSANTETDPFMSMPPLLSVIKADPIISGLLSSLLGRTYITDSLESTSEIEQKLQQGYSFVTLDGDYIDSTGYVCGGLSSEGVFERKREIDDFSSIADEHKEQTDKVRLELEYTTGRLEGLLGTKTTLDTKLRDLDIKEAEISKDLINLKNINRGIAKIYKSLTAEIKSFESERGNKVMSLTDLSKYINELELKKTRFEAGFKNLDSELRELEDKDSEISLFVNQSKVEIAALREKINGLEQELSYYLLRKKELGLKVIIQKTDFEKLNYSKSTIVKKLLKLREDERIINKKIDKDNEIISNITENRKQIEAELKEHDDNLSAVSAELEELRHSSARLDLELNSVDIEIKHLLENTSIEEAYFSAQELDFDLQDMNSKLSVLKNRLERFGPVNLLAPEEYLKLEDRNKFLTDQVEDLENAMESLRKAINKLDRESKARFKETYDLVSEKFGEIFPQIFKGGEGKLELTDPDDLLNTGVEVYVRPKGKKIQSINLLSGGEKALSAITLILSACFVKPAPFLLLDEIDAPLDDNNTRSFLEVIKQISNKSQILLITHNKNTMHDVNYLIGITSQEPGTSKVVSVELH